MTGETRGGRANHLPEVLTEEEGLALLRQTNAKSVTGLRNRVALALMLRAGLRVSEACNLAPKDVELGEESGTLHVWRGKGAKDRTVYLDPELCRLLTLWQAKRPAGSKYLLPVVQTGTRGTGQAKAGRRMSPIYLGALVKRLAKAAGIEKNVHPHTLRHSYATERVREGTPLHEVQADLGHAHLATTSIYLHVFDAERQERAKNRRPIGIV
jgi:integrase/recombinase XerD